VSSDNVVRGAADTPGTHGASLLPTRRSLLGLGAAGAAALLLPAWTAGTAAAAPRGGGDRVLQSLNGTWDFQPAAAGAAWPAPDAGWAAIPVPAEWNMTDGPFATAWGAYDLFGTPAGWNSADTAWYRRTFTVPASSRGRRIVLRFEAVNFEATVFVGGVQVAHHAEGLLPFEADVTDQVSYGHPTTVHVLVRSPEGAARQADGFHHPAGSWWGQIGAGIWQDVWLLARNPVAVDDTYVVTSVTDGTLTVTSTLRNDGPQDATVRLDRTVWDGPRQVLRLTGTATVPAGGTTTATATAPWRDPRLWSPEDPHLYELRTDLRDPERGTALDGATNRFGFREVTVDGPALLLNGEPLLLRGDSWHYMGSIQNSRAYAELWMSMALQAGVNYMRLHAMPYPPVYYDVADEAGMLIVAESGIYGSSGNYALHADDFWANCATHLTDRVRRDRNHPSVIAWSAENEMLAAFGQSWAPQVAALKAPVLAQDTTRPVYFEGDGDPQGAGDLRSTHYPLEITTGSTAIPESARALAPGQPRGNEWDRTKPFLISEFSSMYYANPADVSAVGGPDAYASLDGLWAAHALTLRAQIEGFRYAGITAISPWNTVWYGNRPLPFDGTSQPTPDPDGSGPVLERVGPFAATLNPGFQRGLPPWQPNPIHPAVTRVFQPIAALALDYRTHFRSGGALQRDLLLCNDTGHDAEFTVTWSVRGTRLATRTGRATVTVPATGRVTLPTSLTLPSTPADAAATWQVTVDVAGSRRFTDAAAITVHAPGAAVPALRAAVLEGAAGAPTTAALTALGATVRTLPDLSALPDPASGEVLVIAEGADAAATADDRTRVVEFTAAGGQVLVLAQSRLPQILPWPQFTTASPQTVTHTAAPHHPVLAGIGADDLRWWHTDGERVVATMLVKPRFGSLLALADAGPGLTSASLAEARYGRGRYLLCQYPVVAAQAGEPMAGRLLRNLLRYTAAAPVPTRAAAVLASADGSMAAATLKAAGVDLAVLTSPAAPGALDGLGVLVVDASEGNEASLGALRDAAADVTAWAGAGGTLWIHGATPATLPYLAGLLPSDAALTAVDAAHQHGAVTSDSPLTTGLRNADLDWSAGGAALVPYTFAGSGGTAVVSSRAVSWTDFSAGNEQTKYGRAAHSAVGFTPGAALWRRPAGAGQVLVDQLGWPAATGLPAQVGLAVLLAANLGAAFAAGSGSGELPTTGWRGFTNPATGNPAAAFDRDPGTRWSTDALQKPGMYYGLDMGAVHTITRIIWDTSASSGDTPRGVDLQVSTDNAAWTSVLTLPDTAPYVSGGVLTLDFAPVQARYFKVVDTGSAPGNYMSVHELYVYTPVE
jgi:hypothetical protein